MGALTDACPKLHSIAKERRESVRVDFAVRCLTDFKYYQYIWVDESHMVRSWRSARAQT